jgi:cobalamin biosynthesis protein CbiD
MAMVRTIPWLGKMLSALVALQVRNINRFSHPGKLFALPQSNDAKAHAVPTDTEF